MVFAIKTISGEIILKDKCVTEKMINYVRVNPLASIVKKTNKGQYFPNWQEIKSNEN